MIAYKLNAHIERYEHKRKASVWRIMSRTVLMNGVALLRMYSLGSIKWFMFPSSHHLHADQSKAARYNKVCTLKLRVIYYEFFLSLFSFFIRVFGE